MGLSLLDFNRKKKHQNLQFYILFEVTEAKGEWGNDVNTVVIKLLQAVWIGSWLHLCKFLLLTDINMNIQRVYWKLMHGLIFTLWTWTDLSNLAFMGSMFWVMVVILTDDDSALTSDLTDLQTQWKKIMYYFMKEHGQSYSEIKINK